LLNTSLSNAYFPGIVEAGLASDGGSDVVPVLAKDGNGTSVFVAGQSWIEERPKPTKGKEATENEWKIRAIDYTFFEGGT
jgi:hypothetical protein